MTSQEQRIAIAEFCGWRDIYLDTLINEYLGHEGEHLRGNLYGSKWVYGLQGTCAYKCRIKLTPEILTALQGQTGEWVSVEKELPKGQIDIVYWVVHKVNGIIQRKYSENPTRDEFTERITHWFKPAPLPSPPAVQSARMVEQRANDSYNEWKTKVFWPLDERHWLLYQAGFLASEKEKK